MTHLNNTCPIPEPSFEQHVGIGKQTFFQRNHDELTAFEPISEQLTDMLRMLQVESGVDLVEDVHWCRFELQ